MKTNLPCLLAMLSLAAAATPAEAHSRHGQSWPTGTVLVENRSGIPVSVYVEGSGIRSLRAWETAAVPAVEGYDVVRATYQDQGSTYTLATREVRVRRYRTSVVELSPPTVAHVLAVNDTGVRAEVFVNGREAAELSPGSSRTLSVAPGFARLEMVANGTTVESKRVEVTPLDGTTIVGHAPRFGDIVVQNPLPFAVDISLNGGKERRIEAYGSTRLIGVAVGTAEVSVRRTEGFLVDNERVNVRPWSGGAMIVDVPQTGLVRMQSNDDSTLRVFVDGRLVRMLSPFEDATLLLDRGDATIEVRTLDGRLVTRSFVEVDPLRSRTLSFGRRDGDGRYDEGQHRPEGDHCKMPEDRGESDRGDDRDREDDDRSDGRRHEPATF